MREQKGGSFTFPAATRNPHERTLNQELQQPVPLQDDEEQYADEVYPARLPSSARRYQAVVPQGSRRIVRYHVASEVPPRRSRTEDHDAPRQPQHQPKRRGPHWLIYVGGAMFIMVAGWSVLTTVLNWWQITQDDWHYGRPRTFQVDARVGHDDAQTPSHFIAENLNSHIVVIELPGGNPAKARIFIGPTLIGQNMDLIPVTLQFKDVNGDGKPDMIICIQDNRVVFINDNGTFRPQKPDEHISL